MLGPVEPVLWDDLNAGLDGLMLAAGGVWLESATHAARAYKGLFTIDGLKSARKGHKGCFSYRDPYKRNTPCAPICYQRAGNGNVQHAPSP
jgi:hypothetical protein